MWTLGECSRLVGGENEGRAFVFSRPQMGPLCEAGQGLHALISGMLCGLEEKEPHKDQIQVLSEVSSSLSGTLYAPDSSDPPTNPLLTNPKLFAGS